jgi:hypothetical protein
MGTVTSLIRATTDELDHLRTHTHDIEGILWDPERRGAPSGYLDKSVDELQTLLDTAGVVVNLAPQTMPGEMINHNGTFFLLYPNTIATMAEALTATTRDTIADHADSSTSHYVMANYDNLTAFTADAAARGLGAVMSHN